MITATGYSKDPNIVPEGIAVTFGRDMIDEKGGLLKFLRWFNYVMRDEHGLWLHKMKNLPTREFDHVYIIVHNHVYCLALFGGKFTVGQKAFLKPDDDYPTELDYSGIFLGGPIVKCPTKMIRGGFQGFRYTTKLF